MIETIVLVIALLLILLLAFIIGRAVFKRQKIIGQPPIPVFYFLLAKLLVVLNLTFLLLKGLNITVNRIFAPMLSVEIIALIFLIVGTIILFLSAYELNKELIFGVSFSDKHQLHTKGVFALSRHPFYLGFIFILFSSCLFNPNLINIGAFAGAWYIHHLILVNEEQFLLIQYGDAYRQYMNKVKRYITFK